MIGSCLTTSPRNHLYEVTVAPAIYPIDLAELKIQTRIDWDDPAHDEFLTGIIAAVIEFAENYTKLHFINRTFKTVRDCLDYFIKLRRAPFNSLTSFKYLNTDDVLGDVSSDLYYTLKDNHYGEIHLSPNKSYPTDLTQKLGGVEIVFVAGYGAEKTDVPADIRKAMLQHATFFYQNRGDCCNVDVCCPPDVRAIYDHYKIIELSGYGYHG